VHMWVHEEEFNGRNLSDIINVDHVNLKYLPGTNLPMNLQVYICINYTFVGNDSLVPCIGLHQLGGNLQWI